MTVRFSGDSKPTFSTQFVKEIGQGSTSSKGVQKLVNMAHDFQHKYWDGSTSLLESQFRTAFKTNQVLDLVEFIAAISLTRRKSGDGQAEKAFEALLIALEDEVMFPLVDSKDDADLERIRSIVSCLKTLPQYLDENSWICGVVKKLDTKIVQRRVDQVVIPNFLESEPQEPSLMEELTLLPPPFLSTLFSLEPAPKISSLSFPVREPLQHFFFNRGDCFKVEVDDFKQWEAQLTQLGFKQPLDFRLNQIEWEEGIEFRHPQQVFFNCVPALAALSSLNITYKSLERRTYQLLAASQELHLSPLYRSLRFYLSPSVTSVRKLVEQVFSHDDSQGICFFGGEDMRDAKLILNELIVHLKDLGIKTLFLSFIPAILQEHLDQPEKSVLLKSYEDVFLNIVYEDLSSLFKKAKEDGIRIVGLEIRETILLDPISSLDRSLIKRVCVLQDLLAQHIISKTEGKFIVFSDGIVLNSLYSSIHGISQFPTFNGVPFAPVTLI